MGFFVQLIQWMGSYKLGSKFENVSLQELNPLRSHTQVSTVPHEPKNFFVHLATQRHEPCSFKKTLMSTSISRPIPNQMFFKLKVSCGRGE